MKNKQIFILAFFSFSFIFSFSFSLAIYANPAVLYQAGGYKFTQKNADDLIELAEYIGAANFSLKDKKALQAWSIGDFKGAPKLSTAFYKSLAKVTLPKIRKSKGDSVYRAELYLGFVDSFNKHPKYKKSPDNFLAVIDRYHPPIKEALLIRQIRFNAVMQQMKVSQGMFNQSLKAMQKSADLVNKSIQDQATRQMITIPGGKILREENGIIYAEDYKGQKFEVAK